MLEEIDKNYVIVCGNKIQRPARFSPSQWLKYWEKVYDDVGPGLQHSAVMFPPTYYTRPTRRAAG